MPIVDGLTSTKMIRSFEKTHRDVYSPRAALCGRIPIIAVSASLLERNRKNYIDAGFDAWILKPISFDRLNKLMAAIVDTNIREECLYQPGEWEKGGWFRRGQQSAENVSTKPSGKAPVSNPSQGAQEAAPSGDPMASGESEQDPISEEQARLLQSQEKGKARVYDDDERTPT